MLEVRIRKALGAFCLDVDFTVGNEVLALLGGSGSGKSMTLRCIAGVERPDAGYIALDGRVLYDSEKQINLPPQKRRVGLLFQSYALFPNMTVLQNIMTGVRSGSRADKREIARAALDRYQLQGLGDRRPGELSGGQQQRAALARILVSQPSVLMLDEPFSALDSHLRDRMEREVLAMLRDFGGAALLVSHSRDEVFRMADRVAVYDGGRIDALGEKHEIFQNPRTYHAALLTGCKNFSPVDGLRTADGASRFLAVDWDMELTLPGARSGAICGIRGHHIRRADGPGENVFEMEITGVIEDTFEYVLLLRRPGSAGTPIQWMVPKGSMELPAGSVLVRFPPESLMLLER